MIQNYCYSTLNPRVPFVTLVFPVTAFALLDVFEARNEFDLLDIFGVLVSKLGLDAKAKRRAVLDG